MKLHTTLHDVTPRHTTSHHVTHVSLSGAEPDYESGNSGYTALQLAVQHNNVASVRLLLHYGAKPVTQSPNYDM